MSNTVKGRGILPIPASATKKPSKPQQRAPAPRLRLIIRRLPPGLTEREFWHALGADWQVGSGKVDWAAYKEGKVSKDFAKPSRPARAYLRVKDSSYLDVLSVKVKSTDFRDAKNTGGDSCLIAPPSLEFAPYPKVPGGKSRHDGRQGTIDQDPEFIDFLQSLTEPATKPAAPEDVAGKQEKTTTTPLIEYLREKKANKAKEKDNVAAKTPKKPTEAKNAKVAATPKDESKAKVVVKNATKDVEKARVAKATQDTVKAIKGSVAAMQGKPARGKADTQPSSKDLGTVSQTTPKRDRPRGDVSAAARIIGRDLGLVPKERAPRSARAASSAAASSTSAAPSSAASVPDTLPQIAQPAASSVPSTSTSAPLVQPPTGPRQLRNVTPQSTPLRTSQIPSPTVRPSPRPPSQPSAGAKSAFLKHANPSQGVTEDLLRTVFSAFGTITRCEIDKKKGLGYIDFAQPESLKNAMAVSPVKVGNGSVTVLENRSPSRKVSQLPSTTAPQTPAVRGQVVPANPITNNVSTPDVAATTVASAVPHVAPVLDSPATTQATTVSIGTPVSNAPLPPTPLQGNSRGASTRGFRGGRGGYRGRASQAHRGGGRGTDAASSPSAPVTSVPPATSTSANVNT